jgi:transposase
VATSSSNLVGMTDAERARALARFKVLRPFLENNKPLIQIARQYGIGLRTARRWVGLYRSQGLAGLGRKGRADKSQRRISASLQHLIEGLALQNPPLSAAAVYRKVAAATKIKEPIPSYRTVCSMIRRLDPALKTLAHDGTKAYSDSFESPLSYRSGWTQRDLGSGPYRTGYSGTGRKQVLSKTLANPGLRRERIETQPFRSPGNKQRTHSQNQPFRLTALELGAGGSAEIDRIVFQDRDTGRRPRLLNSERPGGPCEGGGRGRVGDRSLDFLGQPAILD